MVGFTDGIHVWVAKVSLTVVTPVQGIYSDPFAQTSTSQTNPFNYANIPGGSGSALQITVRTAHCLNVHTAASMDVTGLMLRWRFWISSCPHTPGSVDVEPRYSGSVHDLYSGFDFHAAVREQRRAGSLPSGHTVTGMEAMITRTSAFTASVGPLQQVLVCNSDNWHSPRSVAAYHSPVAVKVADMFVPRRP